MYLMTHKIFFKYYMYMLTCDAVSLLYILIATDCLRSW